MSKLEHTHNNNCPKCINNDDSPDYDTILCKMTVPYAVNNEHIYSSTNLNKFTRIMDTLDSCRKCNVNNGKYSFRQTKKSIYTVNKPICQNCYDILREYKNQRAKL